MQCYRCGATEELSLHARRKTMNSMICKDCRRDRNKAFIKPKPINTFTENDEWNLRALDSLDRIARKYGTV